MSISTKIKSARGITVIEMAIFLVLTGMIAFGSYEYYSARVSLEKARSELAASRGQLGVVADEFERQIRRAGYQVKGALPLRTAATFDTLEIYLGELDRMTVDTLRYFVNRFDDPPSLIKQTNGATPAVFAQGIDSVFFVPVGGPPPEELSIVLVSTDTDSEEPLNRKRLGETIALRNR